MAQKKIARAIEFNFIIIFAFRAVVVVARKQMKKDGSREKLETLVYYLSLTHLIFFITFSGSPSTTTVAKPISTHSHRLDCIRSMTSSTLFLKFFTLIKIATKNWRDNSRKKS